MTVKFSSDLFNKCGFGRYLAVEIYNKHFYRYITII